MSLTNNLKKQVDLPVWEWCRAVPTLPTVVGSTTCADNSQFHVTFGRYIYFMQSTTASSNTAGGGMTGFFRYDTIADGYQMLAQPPVALATWSAMQFAGAVGYYGLVLGATANTLTTAALTGKVLKSFDIKIIGGTGIGQRRVITDVSDPTIWDNGTATVTVPASPQPYLQDANKNWTINQWVGYQVRLVQPAGQSQVRKIMYNTSNAIYFADVDKFAEDQHCWNPITTIAGAAALVFAAGTPYQIESSIITVDSNWKVQPDATSRFVVQSGGIWLITAGTNYAMQYYDVAADSWYIRNGAAGGSGTTNMSFAPTDGTIVNTGENAGIWERGIANGAGQSTTALQDMSKNWVVNQWTGYYVRIFSGTAENQINKITSNTSNTLSWTTAGTAPDATSRYFIEDFDSGTLSAASQLTPQNAILVNVIANTSGSANVTVAANTPTICNGWYIAGPGIPASTTISSGQGSKNLVLSATTTANVSGQMIISPNVQTFTATSPSTIATNIITTTTNTPANCNGWYIWGASVGQGAQILSGQGTATLVVSVNNTATFSSGSVYIYPTSPITLTPQFFTTTGGGSGSSTTVTTGVNTPANCTGWYISGTGVGINAIITAGAGTASLTVSVANAGAVSGNVILSPTIATANYSSGGAGGATTVTTADNTPPFCNGWYISGTGIVQGTMIVSGQGTTTLTLSIPAISQISGTLTLSATTISTGSTITGSVFTAGTTTGSYYPGQILLGSGVQSSTIIISPSGACHTLNNSTAVVVFAVGNPAAMGIVPGMLVTDPANPAYISTGTTVSSVTSTSVTLSANVVTALTTQTLQFASVTVLLACTTNTYLTAYVTTTSTAGLYTGAYLTILSGPGTLAVNCYVASVVDATHFTMSAPVTVALNGTVLQAQPLQTIIKGQLSGVPGGAGTYEVFPSQVTASTLIAGKGVSIVQDTTKDWSLERWNGYAVRIRSGTGAGQTRSILRTVPCGSIDYTSAAGATSNGNLVTVSSTTNLVVGMALNITAGTGAFAPGTFVTAVNSATTFTINQLPITALSGGSTVVTAYSVNVLCVTPPWVTPPDNTSVYGIIGDPDKEYVSTAANTATFVHNNEADMITLGRMYEYGAARGATAQYSDYTPVSIASGVPCLPIVSAIGYYATTYAIAASSAPASNVATLSYTIAATSAPFPVGSWITIAGCSQASWIGTWQVIGSTPGSVSFYSTTATGAPTAAGTVVQANSIVLGGTLASGAYAALGATTTLVVGGCVPVSYNATMTVACGTNGNTGTTYGGYQSAPGATNSGATFTVTDTTNMRVGMIPTATAGQGTLVWAANTYVSSVTNSTTFVVTPAPTSGNLGANAVITVVPSFATTSTTAIGNLTTLGYAQKVPQNVSSATYSGTTCTLTTANTVFPIGSWIHVTGMAPGQYNGVFQVTANAAGASATVSYVVPVTAGSNSTANGTVGLATTSQWITTTKYNNFQSGQIITISGDQGLSQNVINGPGVIALMAMDALAALNTRFVLTTSAPAGPMVVYPQSTLQLCDGAKNWVPNQWAGCIVTYNFNQYQTNNTQPTVVTSYILSNTNNTLIFPTAMTALTPAVGVSRYVITAPANSIFGNALGSMDCGLAQGPAAGQSTTVLTDVTKSWATPAWVTGVTVAGGAFTTGNTILTVNTLVGIYPGMVVAVTLGNNSVPAGTVVTAITPTTPSVTVSNGFLNTNAVTLTFAAVCQCAAGSTTVTVNGYPLTNLAVGMYLAVTSTTNISTAVPTAGAFVLNSGTGLTPVKVTGILTATALGGTFTISTPPAVPLVNATVQASFWFTNQWISRRLRQTCGIWTSPNESAITGSTYNTLTVTTAFGTTHTHFVTGYTIFQQPLRGLGTSLLWNFGASDSTRSGKYLYQARGGNLSGWDRLNLNNDKWEFLTPMPNTEAFNSGAMYAYDGQDRIYFTLQATNRVYYLDTDTMQIHGAGMYPYVAGGVVVGNRMEVFETVDGLKYLWLNRNSQVECFRTLLFY